MRYARSTGTSFSASAFAVAGIEPTRLMAEMMEASDTFADCSAVASTRRDGPVRGAAAGAAPTATGGAGAASAAAAAAPTTPCA